MFVGISSLLLYRQQKDSASKINTEVVSENTDYSQLVSVLDKVFNNDISFDDNNNGVLVSEPYSENGIEVFIYKYRVNNSIISQYYEGDKISLDLSKDVNLITQLNEDEKFVETCATLLGCNQTKVSKKEFNKMTWVVVDSFFKPSDSWTRTYFTYDEANSNLIYIRFTSYGIVSLSDYQEDTPISEVSDELNSKLAEIEKVLSKIN